MIPKQHTEGPNRKNRKAHLPPPPPPPPATPQTHPSSTRITLRNRISGLTTCLQRASWEYTEEERGYPWQPITESQSPEQGLEGPGVLRQGSRKLGGSHTASMVQLSQGRTNQSISSLQLPLPALPQHFRCSSPPGNLQLPNRGISSLALCPNGHSWLGNTSPDCLKWASFLKADTPPLLPQCKSRLKVRGIPTFSPFCFCISPQGSCPSKLIFALAS